MSKQSTMLIMPGRGEAARPSGGSLGLSPEMLLKSRRRVEVIAWIVVSLMGVGALFQVVQRLAGGLSQAEMTLNLAGSLLAGGVAMLIVGLARGKFVPDAAVVWIGLVFQILFCLAISWGSTQTSFARYGHPAFMTWVTPLIILFPLLIPVGPRVVVFVGLVAAATEPLSYVALISKENIAFDPYYIGSLINPFAAVAIAWFAARMIHRLNRDVAHARKLGSYQLVERIGRGGMGEVWRAEHALLARSAAIKLVRSETLGSTAPADEQMHRFEHEAQATASLRSAHTVQLYDFGRTGEGAFYLVMELLDGMDLETLVTRFGPLPAARVVHLLCQVCHSLDEAHESGLVHRDIKPANLFIGRYGLDDDFIKVLDFGLVKSHDEPADAGLTNLGTVPGTPAYMSPEAGLGEPIDGRADLYALGCVAYYLLTGTLVFDGETAVGVVAQHIKDLPDPPSSRTELPIPDELEKIVLACLAKNPAERPATARELAELLVACALPAWSSDDAQRWWQIHRPG